MYTISSHADHQELLVVWHNSLPKMLFSIWLCPSHIKKNSYIFKQWVLARTMWPTNHVANTYVNYIHWNMYMYFILIFLSLKINKTEEWDICFTIKCLEMNKRKSVFFHRQPLLCCAFGKLGTIRPNVIGKSQN